MFHIFSLIGKLCFSIFPQIWGPGAPSATEIKKTLFTEFLELYLRAPGNIFGKTCFKPMWDGMFGDLLGKNKKTGVYKNVWKNMF